MLAEIYYYLSHALYAQSMFTEAIKNLDTAVEWHKKNGNANGMYWTLILAFWVYYESGNYEKGVELSRETLDIAIQMNDDFLKKRVLGNIGWLFMAIEDYKTALEYYRQAAINAKQNPL